MKEKTVRMIRIFWFIGVLTLLAGCAQKDQEAYSQEPQKERKVQIGMAFDTFVLERWLRDRDIFLSTAGEMGAEVNVQNANGDQETQISQIEYLIEKQVDVLVIIAIDTGSKQLRDSIEKAHRAGVKVISYDRLIQEADVDLYISFDSERVGALMAQAAVEGLEEGGKIAAIMGSPTDVNVSWMEMGIEAVLEESGHQLVYKTYAPGWRNEYGYEYAEECLDETGDIDVLICGNDALASEAFRALSERKAADHVKLIGQDADIDACQRIVEGQQYMTVYKDLQTLAKQAAQYAVALGSQKELNTRQTVWDGKYEVPAYCLDPVAVTADNLDREIIDSQFHFRDEVYLHIQ